MINYFTLETMQMRKQYSNIFKVLKEKYCQAGTLRLVKYIFQNESTDFFSRHTEAERIDDQQILTTKYVEGNP